MALSAMRIKDVYTYLKQTNTPTGFPYNTSQALIGALTGCRLVLSGSSLIWKPVASTADNYFGDLPNEMLMAYGPAAIGIMGSKFIGGGGAYGIPGLQVNKMLAPVPLFKL